MTPQEQAKYQADVMLAFAEGKTIQWRRYDFKWEDSHTPLWDWFSNEYRVKPSEPKKVIIEAWLDITGEVRWQVKDNPFGPKQWTRLPSSLDLEYEVAE